MPISVHSDVLSYWRLRHGQPSLPKWRQFLEMSMLLLLRGVGPGYYVQARWGRRSIPFKDKWEHMNRGEYQRFIAKWNPRPYQKISQHKLIEKSAVSLQKLPSPQFVGYAHWQRGRAASGEHLRTADQLDAALSQFVGKRLCFKPSEGFGGAGFQSYFVERGPSALSLRDGKRGGVLTPAQWWQRYGGEPEGFLIEEYLDQHPVAAQVHPGSVNTVRLWVILTDQECEVVGGYFRMGRGDSQVDNLSSGGLLGVLDINTGRVLGLLDPLKAMAELPRHPDSGLDMRGFQLPHWEEAKRLAKEAIRAFPEIRVVGLDVAFGAAGPLLIELNVCPDYIGCAWMDMPLKQLDRRMRAGSRSG